MTTTQTQDTETGRGAFIVTKLAPETVLRETTHRGVSTGMKTGKTETYAVVDSKTNLVVETVNPLGGQPLYEVYQQRKTAQSVADFLNSKQ